MDGHPILRWLLPALGGLLIATILLDVFLTVLYARVGAGILANRMACWMWRAFRLVGRRLSSKRRGTFLSYGGPVILLMLVTVWLAGLACGAGLIIWPRLGSSVQATNGQTPRDFATAVYIGGDSMTTVGSSDFAPRTSAYRLFYTFQSIVGMSVITLTLTYFLQVFNALQRRNTFALKVHLGTGETGDAADLIAGLGPNGEFQAGYSQLAEMAAEMGSVKESHHFHSVLMYFRFADEYYAMSRVSLVCMDAVTLIKSALDDHEYAWLKEAAAVEQLWRGAERLLKMLAVNFLPGGEPDPPREPDAKDVERWRRRYFAALVRLRQANVRTIADEEAGARNYVEQRKRWDHHVRALADFMGHDMSEVDLAGCDPAAVERRETFRARMRSAG
jgi:hypothetical protein